MDKLNNPDNITAEKIINRLVEKQLLSEKKKKEWVRKLSSGPASTEDWNLLADFHIKDRGPADE